MISFYQIYEYLNTLDNKKFLRIVAIYVAIVLIFSGILIFRFFRSRAILVQNYNELILKKKKIEAVLLKYKEIKYEKNRVNSILKKEQYFYLQQFVQDKIIEGLGFSDFYHGKLLSEKLENGYIEESISLELKNIDIKKLVDFLNYMDSAERVYLKNLDISKEKTTDFINIKTILSTLKFENET